MASHSALVAVLLCLPLLAVCYGYMKRRGLRRRPPGPRGLPLLGNVFDIPAPSDYPWLKYHELCKQHGTDILRLDALGTNIIMIDSLRPAVELLDKRSSIYSDRPRMIMLNELAGFGWNYGSMQYGDDWRECRKMTHRELHPGALTKYRPVLLKNAHGFLARLASGRGAVPAHLKHAIGANIMEVVYDIEVLPEDDPFIRLAEAGQECIGRSTTGGVYLVEMLPFLKSVPAWFPGAGFKRQAAVWRRAAEKQLHVAYDDFLRRLNMGEASNCMAWSLMEEFGTGDPVTEKRLKATTATVYLGGAETSASALHTFFLAMALHPAVQAKAREELDRIVGAHRLPSFDDFGSIPYIDAIVKEILRWHPIVPILMPHKLCEDDVYEGYHLEKGSIVMVNIWAILHDESRYTNPFAFNPDRFMKDGGLDPDAFDPEEVAFGFGRRVCPGRHLAYETVWIMIASVLSCFEIGRTKDADGQGIELREQFVSSFVCEPKPFKCEIRPRSQQHLELFAHP
ncbi:cytochrome P450 [Trametes coccinea BRFM310]|uniref:Cytochrome P450 n=1 Tax=Trametes coccinea (strain BRFM310) TaxID=1353009 RepID=A0A1Y2ILA3_TRAC3|nr:cytochrome P450 [Trametes coccinea BRFM310]